MSVFELPVLIVDDEESALTSCVRTLRSGDISNVITCADSREVMTRLSSGPLGVILLDLSMPYVSGQELLSQITQEFPEVPVIILTGFSDVSIAVECMKAGAFDYMLKPVEKSRLVSGVRRALQLRQLQSEYGQLKERLISPKLRRPEAFEHIVTNNPRMHAIFQYAETVAPSSQPVLVTGETGVGKDLMARAIHTVSQRPGDFVILNVAGVDENVFSDTLFGHARGAYTGAEEARSGLVEQANDGTLLLNEIGDLDMASQVKLLRLVEERKYLPLGIDVVKRSTARFIFCTNHNLESLIGAGKFRKDLYYRLRTHHMHIPPLRERLEDLPFLLDHFLEKAAKDLGKAPPTPPKELLTLLCTYHFPGNIRELEAMVYDAVSTHTSRMLSMEKFRTRISASTGGIAPSRSSGPKKSSRAMPIILGEAFPTLSDVTQFLLDEALERADGNLTIASQLLGMSRQALSKRLKRAQAQATADSCDERL